MGRKYSISELQDLYFSKNAELVVEHAKGVHDDFRMDNLYHQLWRARVLNEAATFDSGMYLEWCIDAYLHLERTVYGVEHSEVCFEMLLLAHWAKRATLGNEASQEELLQEVLQADYFAYVFTAGEIALDDQGTFISRKALADAVERLEQIKIRADSEYRDYLECKIEHERDGDLDSNSEE